MLLIKNAEIHSPSPEGRCDLLAGGGKILRMHPGIKVPMRYCDVIDARNLIAVPGFIDGHVHIMGGGGEGGPSTRTPELVLSDAIAGGVTTIVGCLGTDGFTRTMGGLLAKAQGLEEEGISTFIVTGHYAIPARTLTGSVEEDLLYIDKVVGVGEVALSDHRSSQPTFEEFARLAGETRRGGILAGKAGLVNIHLGDGRRGLEYLRRILLETEIPARQFLPTHINRNPTLFEEGTAYALAGGFVDFTTSTVPAFVEAGEIKPSEGLRRMLDAGVDPGHITFTSDGQGSLPDFDAAGRIQGVGVGRVTSLFPEVRDAVQREGIDLATALQVITSNPARIFRLRGKGTLAPGMDADIVLLDPRDLSIHTVVAKGRLLMKARKALVKGAFE
jgi:beta-aspartyl-dipeptidase (metallo-type)